MADEIIRQQEIQDHKDLIEKLRECCDRLDELFRLYDTLQLAVPEHNESTISHQDIREDVQSLDERESDHYATVTNDINVLTRDLNDSVAQLQTSITAIENSAQNQINTISTNVNAITSGNFVYTNPILSSVKSTTYLNANTGKVLLNATASSGYNMLLRTKSTNGVYVTGVHSKKFVLSYTNDTTIASNANRVDKTNTLMDEDGNAAFSNNVTVTGTLTAATITGHVTETVDNATRAVNATNAENATYLTSNNNSQAGSNRFVYTSGQMAGYAGSNNDPTTMCYPAGATSVSGNGVANIQNIRLLWGSASGYWHDIFASPNQRYLWHRDVRNGTAYNWKRLVEEDNNTTWNLNISGSANTAATAVNANHAITADTAAQATNATRAVRAQVADNADHAVSADTAVNATNANYATTAGTANNARSADTAVTANSASHDGDNHHIGTYYTTLTTNQTISGNKTLSGSTTVSGDLAVSKSNPDMKYVNTHITKGVKPTDTYMLGNIEFTDKSKNTLCYIRDTITPTGSATFEIATSNLNGSGTCSLTIAHETKTAASADLIFTNIDNLIPDISGGINVGTESKKINTVRTAGLILDTDGVGTIKLLAREYTANTNTSAYSNINGNILYPVSIATYSATTSNNLTRTLPKIVIDHNSPQNGTWQPLQQLSGAWREDSNYIIGLYRRVL